MGGGVKQRGKQKSKGNAKKYFTSAKSAEEIEEILDDIGLESKPKETKRGSSGKLQLSTNLRQPLPESQNAPVWSPTSYAAFKFVISAKFAAALWTTISDCDETFNYWEPTHFFLYGKGFQTWEYSPVYALRSYTYILVHVLPAKIYDLLFHPNPLLVFFLIRCLLAFISATTEIYLYKAVKNYVGTSISCIALVTSLFAPGLFISSAAYLPSSFSSYMTALAIASWLEGRNELAIFAIALSTFLSWPFAALTGVLIAFDIFVVQRKFVVFISWCAISLVSILIPIIAIDSSYYGKLVIAPLNIVKYNIFSSKGPDLYGTEPWSFYILNGFLNFNIMFILSLCAPIFLIATSFTHSLTAKKEKWVIVGTFLIWLGTFIIQPHKEERFLFPVYPLIPYCSVIGLESLEIIVAKIINFFAKKIGVFRRFLGNFNYGQLIVGLALAWITMTGLIGGSRIVALHYGYRAPFDVFFNLHREGGFAKLEQDYPDRDFNLCYGKEWYRFPNSFFLPSTRWNMRFVQSEFKGQLPNLFTGGNDATQRIPEDMNDNNEEESSRYIAISECDFLVDLATTDSALEPNYTANTNEWMIISSQDFLNPQNSHSFFRAFYIPFVSSQYTHYDKYVLLERKQKPKKRRGKGSQRRSTAETEFSDDLL